MEHTDIVLKQNGTPNLWAARAAWISPFGYTAPVKPAGASPTGIEVDSPTIVVPCDREDTSTMTRWRSSSASRSARFARRVSSS